jgi:hypothetical protein
MLGTMGVVFGSQGCTFTVDESQVMDVLDAFEEFTDIEVDIDFDEFDFGE